MAQDITVQRGFLDPPAAADLNTRNLSALYEVVDSRERNPQVLGRLFYGKEMVNRTFGHSLRENSVVIVSPYKIGFYPANLRVFKKSVRLNNWWVKMTGLIARYEAGSQVFLRIKNFKSL